MKLSQYKLISPAINKAIEDALKAHGLKVTKLSASIDERLGTVSISVKANDTNMKDESGNTVSAEAIRYKDYAVIYDLKPEWLNQTFGSGSREYKLVGLRNTRGAKNVLVERDGKQYIMEPAQVKQAFTLRDLQQKLKASA